MPTLLRDLLRQRLRTLLTVVGVSLGIFTLVVLGALGEHFRGMVEEAKAYAHGQVRLFTKTNAQGFNPGITDEVLATVEALPQVAAYCPTLVLYFDGFDLEDDPLSFLIPKPLVEGISAEHAELVRGQGVELLEGRWLRAGDQRHCMVVDWLAARRGYDLGSRVTIRRREYELVGIYHAPDTPMVPAGYVPYAVLNEDYLIPEVERSERFLRTLLAANPWAGAALPRGLPGSGESDEAAGEDPPDPIAQLARTFALQQGSMFRIYEIVPRDRSRAGTQALAETLREALPEMAVIDPERIEERMEKAVAMFVVITLIVTVLSTVVGGLLIVNTMAMAVIERRREIAIRAAVGATPAQIAGEFVAEAAFLALLGAVLGIAGGALAIAACEPWLLGMLESGASLFRITPRLVLLAGGYALVMGVLAGGIPAARAARVDPAIILRGL